VGTNLKIRCRNEKPGLIARATMALVSSQDQQDAELVGRAGVLALAAGETDKMVALLPLDDPGESGYNLVPFTSVVGVERQLPAAWLTNGPLAVGPAFESYLRPLVGELYQYARAL